MLYKLLSRIDLNVFDPYVISLTTKGYYGDKIKALNIPVRTLRVETGKCKLFKLVQLIKILRDIKPACVHTWMYHADLLGGVAACLSGFSSVAWSLRQSNLSLEHNKASTIRVIKVCACLSHWLPTRVLSCSKRARDEHIKVGYSSKKIEIIPNGFDLNSFTPDPKAKNSVRRELGLKNSAHLIGLIGRYDSQKNHQGFIEAAFRVHRVLPEVRFLLVGHGVNTENKQIMSLISDAGLQDYFYLLGQRNDIPRMMASLDLLVSSSWGEAFPNVLGEAMASGTPCVVTDVGDSAEIVGNTGFIVPSGDMGGLAREIIKFLKLSPEARRDMGLCARERVRENYEIGEVVRRYEAFYLSLMEEV